MTQLRLSIELETSQETVSSYEKGKYYPSYQTLVKLSEILHTSIDYMMGRSEVRFPKPSVLSAKEETASALFASLSEAQQDVAIAYMQGLADSPTGVTENIKSL